MDEQPHPERNAQCPGEKHRPHRAPAHRFANLPHRVELVRDRAHHHRLHGMDRLHSEIRERSAGKRRECESCDARYERGQQHDPGRREPQPRAVALMKDRARQITRRHERPDCERDERGSLQELGVENAGGAEHTRGKVYSGARCRVRRRAAERERGGGCAPDSLVLSHGITK